MSRFEVDPRRPGSDSAGDRPWTKVPSGRVTTRDGLHIAHYDLGGEGPALLMTHATGFCGAVLAPMAGHLATRFHCITFDERAHGRSDSPADGDLDWHGFALDVLAVVDGLALREPVGFGHSCGGAALLLAEQARPGTFAALYCYEPVVFPGEHPPPVEPGTNPLSVAALRRRARFASREAALENYSSKEPFRSFHPDALAAYVDNAFARGPGGDLRLCCPPEAESQIYALGFAHDAYAHLGEVSCPVILAGGEHSDDFNEVFLSLLAERLPRARTVVMRGLDHFGPLVDPEKVAAAVLSSVGPTVVPVVRPGDTATA